MDPRGLTQIRKVLKNEEKYQKVASVLKAFTSYDSQAAKEEELLIHLLSSAQRLLKKAQSIEQIKQLQEFRPENEDSVQSMKIFLQQSSVLQTLGECFGVELEFTPHSQFSSPFKFAIDVKIGEGGFELEGTLTAGVERGTNSRAQVMYAGEKLMEDTELLLMKSATISSELHSLRHQLEAGLKGKSLREVFESDGAITEETLVRCANWLKLQTSHLYNCSSCAEEFLASQKTTRIHESLDLITDKKSGLYTRRQTFLLDKNVFVRSSKRGGFLSISAIVPKRREQASCSETWRTFVDLNLPKLLRWGGEENDKDEKREAKETKEKSAKKIKEKLTVNEKIKDSQRKSEGSSEKKNEKENLDDEKEDKSDGAKEKLCEKKLETASTSKIERGWEEENSDSDVDYDASDIQV